MICNFHIRFAEKQRDIENALYLVRKEVSEEKQKYANLMNDMQATQVQLNEAKTGLLAATRISDQLESSQRLIADQKEESKLIWRQQIGVFCFFSRMCTRID